MQTCSSLSSDDVNVESANKDATATEKEKLLREIQELKCITKQCEWKLQTLCFKDVENHVTKTPPQNPEISSTFNKIPNIEVDLQNDLYRFAGFHCVKFRKNEFVFNFTSTNEEQKEENTYAIQIFITDGKAKLGKWVMPMSIDINYILSKTPIDNLKNLTAFIKNCKHNIDCYTVRQEQFSSLKQHISHMKHCTLESDLGLKQINLELYGVHDSENDRYIDLIIYLLYHSDKARPYKIEVDTINEEKLNDSVKQQLKICLKEFKISDLRIAFDKILSEDNSTFTWMRTDDSESPLELNDTSSSNEENYLVQLQSERKRSLRKLQKKRELQKKWNERIKQRNVKITELSEDSEEDNHSKVKKTRTENLQQILMRKKKEKTTSILKQKKIKNLNSVEITPLHKPKVKLKQTKLNFRTEVATNSNANQISFESKLDNRSDSKQLKIAKLITSTPLHHNVKIRNVPLSPNLEINNITSINTIKKTLNKDYSSNSDELGNKKTPEKKIQEKTNQLLRSNTKITGSSKVLTHKRLTRSMTKSIKNKTNT